MHLASSYKNIKAMKLLLKKGANITLKDNNGLTPLNSALMHCHIKVVKLLLKDTMLTIGYIESKLSK